MYKLIFVLLYLNLSFAQDSTLLSKTQLSRDPDNIDVKLFRSINSNRSDFKDAVIPAIDKTMLPFSIALPVGLFVYGGASENTYEENTGFLMFTSELTNASITFGMKFLIKRPRPYITLKDVYCKSRVRFDKFSFPSGHTSAAFNMSTMLALRYPKYPQVYLPMYAWAFVIGYGRVYLGKHYPSDVLGGIAVGSLSAIAIYSLRAELFKFKNRIMGKENEPDMNPPDSKILGIMASSFIFSEVFNEFFPQLFKQHSTSKLSFAFSPVIQNNSAGIVLGMRW